MEDWFLCKAKYEKVLENGMVKKTTEQYLVQAVNVTDAENRIIEEVTPFSSGDFSVPSVKQEKVMEVFFSNEPTDDRWYKTKLSFITLDEKSGREKKSSCNMMVQACSLKKAISNLENGMKESMMDYTIESVSETKIMEVFKYKIQ